MVKRNLQYKNIEKNYYEVFISDDWTISMEGNVCKEILDYLIDMIKKEGGKVNKFRSGTLFENETKEELIELRKENKYLIKKLNTIHKTSDVY